MGRDGGGCGRMQQNRCTEVTLQLGSALKSGIGKDQQFSMASAVTGYGQHDADAKLSTT